VGKNILYPLFTKYTCLTELYKVGEKPKDKNNLFGYKYLVMIKDLFINKK